MNKILLLALLGLLAAGNTLQPAQAAGVSGHDQFLAACLKAGGANAVCTCKANAAVKLLNAHMLDLVILSMKSPSQFAAMSQKGGLSHADNLAWTAYIRESNKACSLNY